MRSRTGRIGGVRLAIDPALRLEVRACKIVETHNRDVTWLVRSHGHRHISSVSEQVPGRQRGVDLNSQRQESPVVSFFFPDPFSFCVLPSPTAFAAWLDERFKLIRPIIGSTADNTAPADQLLQDHMNRPHIHPDLRCPQSPSSLNHHDAAHPVRQPATPPRAIST